jgi:hypothetical protein
MARGMSDVVRRVVYPLVAPLVLASMWLYAHVQQRDWWMENQPVTAAQAASGACDSEGESSAAAADAPAPVPPGPQPASAGVFTGWMADPSDSAGYFNK